MAQDVALVYRQINLHDLVLAGLVWKEKLMLIAIHHNNSQHIQLEWH